MTQEDKQLLLKDLCARLPYGVKVHCGWNMFQGDRVSEDGELVSINTYAGSIHFKRNSGRITEIPFNRIDGTVLPYLRSMSNMTEEERNEYFDIKLQETERVALAEVYRPEAISIIMDWLNAHHFDYRNLIEKGLALKAPKELYKY